MKKEKISKCRVLHISKYYHPFVGGTEQTARDCVKSLSAVCEQKIICFNHERGSTTELLDGIEIHRCDCQFKVASQSISLEYGKRLKYLISTFRPDYILFHYPNPYVAYFLLKQLTEKTRLILYWHLDTTRQKILGKFFYFQNILLLEQAYKVVATSPNYIEGSKFLRKYKEKCVVIPSCINENRLLVDADIKEKSDEIRRKNQGKIICTAVGRHVTYKGYEYLIKASRLLDKNIVIYLIGKGKLTDSLKQLAKGDDKVKFLGMVDDVWLKAYYLATDIFCFPSITKNEAFGLALAEAMYFGKPAVTFEIYGSGVNYVSVDQETGIEVDNRSVEEYAMAINRLAADSDLRSKYGRAAQERVKSRFLYTQYKANIEKLFHVH